MPVRPKPIFSSQSYSSQDKTDFLHSKPFKSGKNQLPTFHALHVSQKPTFSILSHSSQSNIVNEFFLLTLPCRSKSPNYSVLVYVPPVTS
jgi:hypothetical protein